MARIVYIEDDEALRPLVTEILTDAGHHVVAAANGTAGTDAISRERPDLVLCDVNMPGMDGYAVLAVIRADPRFAATPFLFLTGLADKSDVRGGMASGADDYLTKPARPEELLAAIDARLARRESGRLEANRIVDEMRRSVATLLPHELRTPITTILGGSQLLAQAGRDLSPEEVEELARSMFKAAQRLQRLAENYILYAELESLRLSDPAEPPHGLAGGSGEAEVREAARTRSAEWDRMEDLLMELEGATVPLAAAYLHKVAAELIDNAFKFSQRGTPVSVVLRSFAPWTVLEVADRGHGMTPEQVREIGAFRQFDRSLLEQQGSGLGLALVRAIVRASAGDVDIESRSGEGTRVRVRWPVA